MNADPSTPTNRRIFIQSAENLTHMRTYQHGSLPLTNPGRFKAGIYRGIVNQDGTATITEEMA